jgi:Na+/H+ antiporter NhaD/arsenite permease-like protein
MSQLPLVMQQNTARSSSDKPVLALIAILLVLYAAATAAGWTTRTAEAHEAVEIHDAPHRWAVIPFTLLLGAIAVLPLMESTAHWWESNRNKFFVAINLALITLAYLALLHPSGSLGYAGEVLMHTIVQDYIPFIVLLFSLYTISGGIRIEGDLRAHSATNATFMLVGGVLASLIGTTGAAMLLIRPLLETNRERRHVAHTAVFFTFIVCNCGGLLLPLGDPPLFLGYLQGVPFLWTLRLWPSWLLVNGLLLAIYFLWDRIYFYPRESVVDRVRDRMQIRPLRFIGVWPNAVLLCGVIFSVALLSPDQAFPGTDWHPWFYLREAVQLGLVGLSLLLGPRVVRDANGFNYVAIIEVAALFIGIFICMQPALQILNLQGASLGIDTPMRFFWATGWLSSVLDNAPTYLVFFNTARAGSPGLPADAELVAISLGAVMMGAMTYIGNGPNFMVKSIAETSGVKMPSFFGYCVYSFLILLPILALNAWLFLPATA